MIEITQQLLNKIILLIGGIMLGIIIMKISSKRKIKSESVFKLKEMVIETNKSLLNAHDNLQITNKKLNELYKVLLKIEKVIEGGEEK